MVRADEVRWTFFDDTSYPLTGAGPFREQCRLRQIDLSREFMLLSPYLLPVPAMPTDPGVLDCAAAGYSTVVRLPFRDAGARAKAEKLLAALGPDTLLFLDGLEVLRIDDGKVERELRRTKKRGAGMRTRVAVSDNQVPDESRDYWLWQRTIGGATDPAGAARIRRATSGMIGRWP